MKKIVKKKLADITEREALMFCFKRGGKDCECCPLMFYADKKIKHCLYDYFLLKHSKEMFSDREIEIEIEK